MDCEEGNDACVKKDGVVSRNRDCHLVKVGEPVISFPITFPVRADLTHSLGWALMRGFNNGLIQKYQKKRASIAPASACEEEEDEEGEGMPAKSMYGTVIITEVGLALALVVSVVDRMLQARLGPQALGSLRAADEEETSTDVKAAADKTQQKTEENHLLAVDELSAKLARLAEQVDQLSARAGTDQEAGKLRNRSYNAQVALDILTSDDVNIFQCNSHISA